MIVSENFDLTNGDSLNHPGSSELTENLTENTSSSPINNLPEVENFCFPAVTPEIAVFLQQLAVYAQAKLGGDESATNPFLIPSSTNNIASTSSSSLMIKNGDIVFNKSKEVEFTRFKKRPEEMVRRLLLELVGREELKTMTALGFARGGKTGKAVPEEIRNAVYTKGFTYEKFIDTINNQCCTLRNPKKEKPANEKVKKIRKVNNNNDNRDEQNDEIDGNKDDKCADSNDENTDQEDKDSENQDEENVSEQPIQPDSESPVAKKRKH
ncbi:uncharacterized protein LOC122508727 [Leptopilina heterotoma]|uniref:uncharacterized protein LOC122508727 n=1 Tax=Leptopilina heterotoma TaxID=63436 RepID=UPI001CA919B4|nr:uncharacterized protein LOC122508727 [Leptopilina heterotoma]